MVDYSLELSKSGRSTCQGCKEKIAKGEIRVCVSSGPDGGDGIHITKYHHASCFKLPRKFSTGANKLSVREFIDDHVTDATDDQCLLGDEEKKEEIIQMMEAAKDTIAKKKKAKATDDSNIMARIKKAAEDDEPKKKKQKTDDDFDSLVKEYRTIMADKPKVDELKDYLRWNRQVLKGTKDIVSFKVIDGKVNGRIGLCGMCGGKLKLEEDLDTVVCNGTFDEENQFKMTCSNQYKRLSPNLPRLDWYNQEPTKEESDAMDKYAEQAQGGGGGAVAKDGENINPKATELLKQAAKVEWSLSNSASIKSAHSKVVKLVKDVVAVPDGKEQEIGKLILANKSSSCQEIVQMVIDKYGFEEDKKAKAQAREAQAEDVCTNPKNAPLLMAFQELAQCYFKLSNANAGATYTKVANAVKDMKEEITASNAMSFSKGKKKVQGIGPTSGKLMKEFMETGIMQKLEDKRAML